MKERFFMLPETGAAFTFDELREHYEDELAAGLFSGDFAAYLKSFVEVRPAVDCPDCGSESVEDWTAA